MAAQSHASAYAVLAEQLAADGLNVEQIKAALKAQRIETPSWGYANSGTRFKAFPWPGAARTTREKLDDAATVHKYTGIAPTVAVHIPWDKPEDGDYVAMGQYAQSQGVRIGAVNPNVFQDEAYRLGSLGHPHSAAREMALDHLVECCDIMGKTGSDLLSLWFADGTNYAGQDDLRARKRRFEDGLSVVYKTCPPAAACSSNTNSSSRPSTPPTSPTGARPTPGASSSARRRRFSSTSAITRRASTSSRSWRSCSTKAASAASTSTTASTPTTT